MNVHINKIRPFVYVAITALLMGALAEAGIMYLIVRPALPQIEFAMRHPAEVKWSMERYSLIQKAAGLLYFEDKNFDAISVVRKDDVVSVPK